MCMKLKHSKQYSQSEPVMNDNIQKLPIFLDKHMQNLLKLF
jgi:hypothetical protein